MKWKPLLQDPPDYLEIDRLNLWDELMGPCMPRFAPPITPGADSELAACLDIAAALGADLIPWQAFTFRLSTERDEDRLPVWREVGLSTPRQPGKSVVLAIRHLLELLREVRAQTVFAFQDGTSGKERFVMDIWPMIEGTPLAELFGLRRNLGNPPFMEAEKIRSFMKIWRGGEKSQHGASVVLATMDEAWWHDDDSVEQAILPAVLRHAYGQIWNVSTAGEDDRAYFLDKRDQGRKLVETGLSHDRRICWIEWSADDDISDEDAGKEEEWLAADPAIGWTSRVRDTRHAYHTMKLDSFKRAHLNIVRDTSPGRIIPRAAWKAAQIDPDSPEAVLGDGVVLGFDATPTTRAKASAAAADASGLLKIVAEFALDRTEDERVLVDWMLKVLKEYPAADVVILSPGPLDVFEQTLADEEGEGHGRDVSLVNGPMSRQACGYFNDGVLAGWFRIAEHEGLTHAQAHAVRSAKDDNKPGWVFIRPDNNPDLDLTPLIAGLAAVFKSTHDPAGEIFVGGRSGVRIGGDGVPD